MLMFLFLIYAQGMSLHLHIFESMHHTRSHVDAIVPLQGLNVQDKSLGSELNSS